jgi:hypothetical protein
MRISTLISQLEQLKKEEGDLLVKVEYQSFPSFAINPKGLEITIRFEDISPKKKIVVHIE